MGIIMTSKELRPRQENDFYPTPIELCRAALKPLKELNVYGALDPGCGTGVWGQAIRESWPDILYLGGVDIVNRLPKVSPYDYFLEEDFLSGCHALRSTTPVEYQLIAGNPPYRLAEEFIRTGYRHLSKKGVMVYLLRLAFLEGQKRCKDLWSNLKPTYVYVLGRRPSFTGNGHTDATAYCLMYWYKNRAKDTTQLYWLDWDYDK